MSDPVLPEKEPAPDATNGSGKQPRARRPIRPVDIAIYVIVAGFAIYLIISGLVGVLTKAS